MLSNLDKLFYCINYSITNMKGIICYFKGIDVALEEALSVLTVKVKLSVKYEEYLVPFGNVVNVCCILFFSFSVSRFLEALALCQVGNRMCPLARSIVL